MLSVLLEAGADPDFVDNEGQTPLHYAVKHGKLPAVEKLVSTGAVDLTREDAKGQGLVALAIKQKKNAIAEFLLKAGCPPPAGVSLPATSVVSGNQVAGQMSSSSLINALAESAKKGAPNGSVRKSDEVNGEDEGDQGVNAADQSDA